MGSAVGIRVYRIGVTERGNRKLIDFNSPDLRQPTNAVLKGFLDAHQTLTSSSEAERSWYFELKTNDGKGNSCGYVHYGTFGFESNLMDSKTKTRKYRRLATDVEEIPLFFEFWCPPGADFGLVAFQSFRGRSCVGLVISKLQERFEAINTHHYLQVNKISPADATGSAYFSAPVRELRLIKKRTTDDTTDDYFSDGQPDLVNVEVILSARRNRSLGSLGSLLSTLHKKQAAVIMHEGIEYPDAVAEIRVGNRTRKVGVLGYGRDTGVIDLTDAVKRGADGHPNYQSMKIETSDILRDLYRTLKGVKT